MFTWQHTERCIQSEFEVQQWKICGQDFIVYLCGSINVLTPAMTYLVELQNLQAPIWKAVVWYPKVEAYLKKLGDLSIDSPPQSCLHPNANIADIKKFKFHEQELVDGWLQVGSENKQTEEGMVQLLNWQIQQLKDVETDLQQLVKDMSASLHDRQAKCLSSLQSTLTCMDIDSILNLLVGDGNHNGFPSLTKEDEFVMYGKEDFRKFYAYMCSLPHVKELMENHVTELKKSIVMKYNPSSKIR